MGRSLLGKECDERSDDSQVPEPRHAEPESIKWFFRHNALFHPSTHRAT